MNFILFNAILLFAGFPAVLIFSVGLGGKATGAA
jgi:hypothetical protein